MLSFAYLVVNHVLYLSGDVFLLATCMKMMMMSIFFIYKTMIIM